jgi:hypothetical protein
MTLALRNIQNLELLSEVVRDLRNDHLIGLESRWFNFKLLRSIFPGKDDLFDWVIKFFGGENNYFWLENVCKIEMVGSSKSRQLLISNRKKENLEKKIPKCVSKITISTYSKKDPKIQGLNLAIDCWIVKPIPALITPNIGAVAPARVVDFDIVGHLIPPNTLVVTPGGIVIQSTLGKKKKFSESTDRYDTVLCFYICICIFKFKINFHISPDIFLFLNYLASKTGISRNMLKISVQEL